MFQPTYPHPFVRSPDRRASLLAKVGAWMQIAFVIGLIGTIRGMMKAFETLGTNGVGDPAKLSAAIGEVLITTFIGSVFSMIGCVLLGIAVFSEGNQPRWVKVLFCISALPAAITVIIPTIKLIGSQLRFGF